MAKIYFDRLVDDRGAIVYEAGGGERTFAD